MTNKQLLTSLERIRDTYMEDSNMENNPNFNSLAINKVMDAIDILTS